MAEYFRFNQGRLGFSEILGILERWEAEPGLTDEGRDQLRRCLDELEGKDDPLSTMARDQAKRLLDR